MLRERLIRLALWPVDLLAARWMDQIRLDRLEAERDGLRDQLRQVQGQLATMTRLRAELEGTARTLEQQVYELREQVRRGWSWPGGLSPSCEGGAHSGCIFQVRCRCACHDSTGVRT